MTQRSAYGNLDAFFSNNFKQDARNRRLQFVAHLLGFQFDDGFAHLHKVSLALEPAQHAGLRRGNPAGLRDFQRCKNADPPSSHFVRYAPQGLKSVRENWVPSTSLWAGSPGLGSLFQLFPSASSAGLSLIVPPGLALFLPLFPALKRWAKLGRPSGAGFLDFLSNGSFENEVR
jgi:hypothetical protein